MFKIWVAGITDWQLEVTAMYCMCNRSSLKSLNLWEADNDALSCEQIRFKNLRKEERWWVSDCLRYTVHNTVYYILDNLFVLGILGIRVSIWSNWISFWWPSSLNIYSMLSTIGSLSQLWLCMISSNSSFSTPSKSEQRSKITTCDQRSQQVSKTWHILEKDFHKNHSPQSLTQLAPTYRRLTGRYFSFCQLNVIIWP